MHAQHLDRLGIANFARTWYFLECATVEDDDDRGESNFVWLSTASSSCDQCSMHSVNGVLE